MPSAGIGPALDPVGGFRPGPAGGAQASAPRVPALEGREPIAHRQDGGLPLRLALPDAGFMAHLIITAGELDEPAPPAASPAIDAYHRRLMARISYSGPWRPVDLRI